jgi:1-phosphatidylinositol-3-phosphate 5-kinase
MVEKTVARLALEFLLDANIAVIPNVKLSLLFSISRATGADIVHSIDQLSHAKIGRCESFVFKTFINSLIPDFRKTFVYVEGNSASEHLSCTLVLRGGSNDELGLIKTIVDFLVFAIYNLKLETSLIQDEYVMNPSVEEPTIESAIVDGNPYDRAVFLYKTVILSASPNVRFPVPFLLANRESSTADKSSVPTTEVMDESHIPLLLIAERLSPINHQNLIVLYSNNSPSTIIPCSPPRPHLIEYYRESDLTLGQFIEDACIGSNLLCDSCQKYALKFSFFNF